MGETQGTCGCLPAVAVSLCPLPWERKQKRRRALCGHAGNPGRRREALVGSGPRLASSKRGGLNQRFVLPPAGKHILSFLGPGGSGRAVHSWPQSPAAQVSCLSLELPPLVTTLPQTWLPLVSQTRENPAKGPFQLSLPLPLGCMSSLRQPQCGMYPGPYITTCLARADRAGKSHNTPCEHPWVSAGAEKALYGHQEKGIAFALLLSSSPTFTGSACRAGDTVFWSPGNEST